MKPEKKVSIGYIVREILGGIMIGNSMDEKKYELLLNMPVRELIEHAYDLEQENQALEEQLATLE